LKWNAVPTIFSGSSEQELSSLKRPVTSPVEHLIRSVDHEYSKKPRLDKENLLRDAIPLPNVNSTANGVQYLPTANDSIYCGRYTKLIIDFAHGEKSE
jgi:hypothetical protein